MTIREFSDKYGVPYSIAYGASYKVTPIATLLRDRDYPEKEMFDAVTEVLTNRVDYHRSLMAKDIAILHGMGIEVKM